MDFNADNLRALQHVVSMALVTNGAEITRVNVDVASYKQHRAERIAVWQNVETEPKGYQILQGLYAIASGGLFGTQLGGSKQKLGFIPEAHNDMIFTVICEELGLFGAVSLMLLFVLLLYRIFIIGLNAGDLFGSLICVGVFVHIAVQVVLNIAVVTNAVPSTGVPLPFISYGGTSVSILMAEIGIVLSVSNQMHTSKIKENAE